MCLMHGLSKKRPAWDFFVLFSLVFYIGIALYLETMVFLDILQASLTRSAPRKQIIEDYEKAMAKMAKKARADEGSHSDPKGGPLTIAFG